MVCLIKFAVVGRFLISRIWKIVYKISIFFVHVSFGECAQSILKLVNSFSGKEKEGVSFKITIRNKLQLFKKLFGQINQLTW